MPVHCHPRHLMIAALLASAPTFAGSMSDDNTLNDSVPNDSTQCHAGVYRLDDDSVVAVNGVSEPGQLRWRRIDGQSGLLKRTDNGSWISTLGWTNRADGIDIDFGDCKQARMSFDGHTGEKLEFAITDTMFASGDVNLRGRLVMPQGRSPVPVVVEVHGSETTSAVDLNYMQQLFPAQGIGVFVYDKRGTGKSSGSYTQNFQQLSDDASNALREAQRLAGHRAGRVGFRGASQGGWVAPLAASKTPAAQFVLVAFGLADDVLAEDRNQVALDLRRAGFGDASVANAREVTDATAAIVSSHGARGWEQLDAARAKYDKTAWWPAMTGEFSGMIAKHTREEVEAMAPKLDVSPSWDYDPMPVLSGLAIPQLWILAANDVEAPPEETKRRLRALASEDKPITAVEFPGTDHSIVEFTTNSDNQRVGTRYAEGYLRMQTDWIRDGQLDHWPYGSAEALVVRSKGNGAN